MYSATSSKQKLFDIEANVEQSPLKQFAKSVWNVDITDTDCTLLPQDVTEMKSNPQQRHCLICRILYCNLSLGNIYI
jgi:hypothetical protein